MRTSILALVAVVCAAAFGRGAVARDRAATELLGQPPPGWEISDWIQGGPVRLEDLKGRVVLVRWWTGPGCRYCTASAPYLNSWHETYAAEGLVVIGLYHHKSTEPLEREQVARLAERLGFAFPVGIDTQWQTLRRWWLDDRSRAFTSVTFLIDREGLIRHVHPGGSYSKREAAEMEARIRTLLRAGPSG
jgi:peroxiredoxin